MAIQESKKQTDLEKRLKLLRQQIYGKTGFTPAKSSPKTDQSQYQIGKSNTVDSHILNSSTHSPLFQSDLTYLYQDLFKIGVFATFALGIQIILFFLTKNHILNLNFFEGR